MERLAEKEGLKVYQQDTNLVEYLKKLINRLETMYRNTALRVNHTMGLQVTTENYDPPSVAAQSRATKTVTVTDAALGDFVLVSFSIDLAGLILDGQVTSANTVTCSFHNPTAGAIDIASGILRVRVLRK